MNEAPRNSRGLNFQTGGKKNARVEAAVTARFTYFLRDLFYRTSDYLATTVGFSWTETR